MKKNSKYAFFLLYFILIEHSCKRYNSRLVIINRIEVSYCNPKEFINDAYQDRTHLYLKFQKPLSIEFERSLFKEKIIPLIFILSDSIKYKLPISANNFIRKDSYIVQINNYNKYYEVKTSYPSLIRKSTSNIHNNSLAQYMNDNISIYKNDNCVMYIALGDTIKLPMSNTEIGSLVLQDCK